MRHPYSSWLPRWAARPLAALGLLLATAGATQAQTVSFSAPALYATGANSQGIVTADFNGDGRPDLATANSNASSVSVLLQSGTSAGTFLATTNYSSGGSFNSTLAVGDLNGDSRPDIATIHESSGTVGVLLNSATTPGTFAAAVAYGAGGSASRGIAIADLNGDGRLDLVTANSTTVGVLLNSATAPGTFGAVTTYSGGGPELDELMVGDLDGDGRPDVVVASRTGTTVSVLLNSTTTPGTLRTASLYTIGSSAFLRGVALGDLNNDGRLDIAASNYQDRTVSVLLNSASTPGTFPATANYSVGNTQNPYGVAIGDVSGDGLADLVLSNYNGASGNTISLLVNSATAPGTFSTAPTVYTTGGTGTIRALVRDLNADGRLDVAVSHILSQSVGVLLNTTVFMPTLTSVSPTSATAGTSVTLTGSNLTGATAVTFAGTSNNTVTTGLTVSGTGSNQTITVVVPTGANTGNVTVTTPGGTSNGVAFTVIVAPTVTTAVPTSITTTSAQVGGSVTNVGGDPGIYSRGIVYVQGTGTPTLANTLPQPFQSGGMGPGTFQGFLQGLTPGTTYTVRAYATNSAGTGYGTAISFTTTQATTPTPAITSPANGSTLTTRTPNIMGTAPAGSTVTVYLAAGSSTAQAIGTTTATGGSFSFTPATALTDGTYQVYATAQSSGSIVSANSNTNTFVVDATAPTVTVTTTATSPTSTSPISFLVSFSEPITGLSASSFTVSNGTVTSGPTSSGTNAFAFSVTPTGNGPVTVSLAANAVRDAVGNGNTASNAVSVQYTAPVVSGLRVQYQTGDFGQPTDGQVRPFFQLVNSGASAVSYSQLTVRYWLTVENFKGQLVTPIDYAKLGTNLVSARYVQLATPRQGALGYIEYSFAAGAGSLNPGTDSGPIYGKAYKPDYTNVEETDDWSYQTSSAFTTNSHVTLYQNGTLIDGTEPPAVTATTALQVLSASRDNAASTSYVSVQLQLRNTGNLPVSYGDVRARYYFTRDGATTVVPELDYAKLGNNNVSLRVVNLPATVNGADAYVEVTFSSALGVLYPRTSTDDILFKLRKDNYQPFDQTNDYSFNGSTALAPNPRVTAYVGNQLVYGTPPNSNPANRTAATPAPASASGATIVAAASGPLALTASPNPFGEQLTLRFALPTAQAYTLAVYDGQGRLVQQLASGQAEAEQAQEVAVPTQGYAAGLYLVRLTTAEGVQTLKLVKR